MSNKELQFNPTADQMFELEGRGRYNFVRHKESIDALVKEGRYDEACEARYEAFQLLVDVLPEDDRKRKKKSITKSSYKHKEGFKLPI